MTSALYLAQEQASHRRPCLLVEIDLDRCLNHYSIAAGGSTCTATDLGDGHCCDYAYPNCQDREHFRKGTITLRFLSADVTDIPADVEATWGKLLYPCILDVTAIQQEIDTEAGFTRPGKLTVKLREIGSVRYDVEDGTTSDPLGCPPFNADKEKRNSSRRGSFFRRLVSMNPNYKGRAIRVYRGFLTDDWATTDFELRWVGKLENITFGNDGNPTIHAIDLFDGIDTKLPPKVDAVIAQHFPRSATLLYLTNVSKVTSPDDINGPVVLAAKSAVTGRTEYMRVTARDVGMGAVLVERAYAGSIADPHEAGEELKEVLAFVDVHAIDVALDLLDRCKMDAALIDDVQIRAQASWLGPQTLSRIVDEEAAARDLLFEILGDLYQANLYAAESGKAQLLVMNPGTVTSDGAGGAVREASTTIEDAPDILAKSASSNVNELARLTHCVVLFDQQPGQEGTSDSVFQQIEVDFNGETSVANYYGDLRPRTIKTKWLDTARRAIAIAVGMRWVLRFAHAPLRFQWEADLRDGALVVGSAVTLETGDVQDGNGDPLAMACRILRKRWAGLRGYEFMAQQTRFGPVGPTGTGRYAYIGPNTLPNYGSATAAQRVYGFISGNDERMGNGDDGYYCC